MSKNAGRPTVITSEVVSLLITSFHNGLTVREACWQSGISHETYYRRLRNDDVFANKMHRAQPEISMTAKRLLSKEIRSGNVQAARWWLERNLSKDQKLETEILVPDKKYIDEQIESIDRLLALKETLLEDKKRDYIA